MQLSCHTVEDKMPQQGVGMGDVGLAELDINGIAQGKPG